MKKKKVMISAGIVLSILVIAITIFLIIWFCVPLNKNKMDINDIEIEVKNPITKEWMTDMKHYSVRMEWNYDGVQHPVDLRFKHKGKYIELSNQEDKKYKEPIYIAPTTFPTEIGKHKINIRLSQKDNRGFEMNLQSSLAVNITIYGELSLNKQEKVILEEELSNFQTEGISFSTGTFTSWIKPYKFMVKETGIYKISVSDQFIENRKINLKVLGVENISTSNSNEIIVDLEKDKEYILETKVAIPMQIYFQDDYYILNMIKIY